VIRLNVCPLEPRPERSSGPDPVNNYIVAFFFGIPKHVYIRAISISVHGSTVGI
jgi:hypothetical protein